jgi:uncharacterized protein YcfL
MIKLFALALAAFAFVGCATTGSNSKFYDDPDGLLVSSRIEIRNVTVTVDYVSQKDIEAQIRRIAASLVDGGNVSNSVAVAYADIEANQRSFIDGIDPKNSLFVTLTVTTAAGLVIVREHAYAVGNETVLSSAVQQKYLALLVGNVNREREREAKQAKK